MSDKEEILAKIKKMPIEDILRYKRVASGTNMILNIIGVMILMLMFVYPNMGMIFAGIIFVFLLANTSVGVSQFQKEISEILDKKFR